MVSQKNKKCTVKLSHNDFNDYIASLINDIREIIDAYLWLLQLPDNIHTGMAERFLARAKDFIAWELEQLMVMLEN